MNKQSRLAPAGVSISPVGTPATPADTHYLAVRAELIAEGHGLGPRCISCRRTVYGCVCNYPDPEPQYFRPGTVRDIDSMVDWRRL